MHFVPQVRDMCCVYDFTILETPLHNGTWIKWQPAIVKNIFLLQKFIMKNSESLNIKQMFQEKQFT